MSRGDRPVDRFLAAIVNSSTFRREIASGDRNKIAFALAIAGVELPPPFDTELIDTCVDIFNRETGWSDLDNLRQALVMESGGVG